MNDKKKNEGLLGDVQALVGWSSLCVIMLADACLLGDVKM